MFFFFNLFECQSLFNWCFFPNIWQLYLHFKWSSQQKSFIYNCCSSSHHYLCCSNLHSPLMLNDGHLTHSLTHPSIHPSSQSALHPDNRSITSLTHTYTFICISIHTQISLDWERITSGQKIIGQIAQGYASHLPLQSDGRSKPFDFFRLLIFVFVFFILILILRFFLYYCAIHFWLVG